MKTRKAPQAREQTISRREFGSAKEWVALPSANLSRPRRLSLVRRARQGRSRNFVESPCQNRLHKSGNLDHDLTKPRRTSDRGKNWSGTNITNETQKSPPKYNDDDIPGLDTAIYFGSPLSTQSFGTVVTQRFHWQWRGTALHCQSARTSFPAPAVSFPDSTS